MVIDHAAVMVDWGYTHKALRAGAGTEFQKWVGQGSDMIMLKGHNTQHSAWSYGSTFSK